MGEKMASFKSPGATAFGSNDAADAIVEVKNI
jgi:hypothetical protein